MTADQINGQIEEAARMEAGRNYKCPDCGGETFFMGQDFKAPRKNNVKAWLDVEAFIRSGKIYYRGVSCDD